MNKRNSEIVWGDEVNALRLGISLEKKHYDHTEKPIILEILVTNISAHMIRIVETHILNENEFELSREGDEPVNMTPEGTKVKQAVRDLDDSRRVVVNLDAETVHKVEPPVKLDEWFQLEKPGTYTVQVQRRDWQGEAGVLTSGQLTFVIADEGDKLL